MKVRLLFKPRYFWVGIYWRRGRRSDLFEGPGDRSEIITEHLTEIWLCLIPCFPIHFTRIRYRSIELRGAENVQ